MADGRTFDYVKGGITKAGNDSDVIIISEH